MHLSSTDEGSVYVKVSAPKDPGYYRVILAGKGSYTGENSLYFKIVDAADFSNYELEYNRHVAYTGTPITPEKLGVKMSLTDINGKTTTLVNGTDYTVTFDEDPAPSTLGEYEATVQGRGKFAGSSRTFDFYINDAKDISYASVTGIESEYYLGGAPIAINPVVTALDGTRLAAGKHYTVTLQSYNYAREEYVDVASVSKPGAYRVRIEGIASSEYFDYQNEYFAVYPASSREDLAEDHFIDGIPAGYTYTGKAFAPVPIVRSKSSYYEKLTAGQDYTVAYSGNVNAGTAKVTVTGKGAYTGSLSKTFAIAKAANAMSAKAAKGVVKVKAKSVKKKAKTVANIKVTGVKGKLTYKNESAKKAKKFKLNASNGKITIPKKAKKGTYTIKVKIADDGGKNYVAATKVVTFKVKVN